MEIAIIGLPQSGKSTLFKIMTGAEPVFGETAVRAIAKVPDDRFLELVKIFKPEKVTPAAVPFIDINASGENAWNAVRQNISGAEAVLHVVDAFTNSDISEVVKSYRKLAGILERFNDEINPEKQ